MRKTATVLATTLLLIPFTAPGAPPTTKDVTPQKPIVTKCADNDIAFELDHVTGKWIRPADVREEDFQVDLNGVPTLFLSTKVKLCVRVIRTNPLLFSVTPGEAKAEDVSGLKDLQDFVTRLGGVLGRLVSIETKVSTADGKTLWVNDRTFIELKKKLAETVCVGETLASNRRAIVMFLNDIEAALGSRASELSLKRLFVGESTFGCGSAVTEKLPIDVRTASVAVQDLERAAWALLKAEVPRLQDGAVDPKAESVLKDVERLLAGSGTLISGAAEIQTFVARMEGAGINPDACNAYRFNPDNDGMIPFRIDSTAVKWNQKITRPFKLRVDSSFAKDVATRRRELDVSFATAWRGGTLLGVGVGMVYTPLTAPTWSAAAKPGDSTVQVVTKTDEESRAGTFGLFLNVRAAQAIWPSTARNYFIPALQLGTGFDPNKPSLFAGLAWEPGIRYVRLGVGCTWQQVKRLNGQSEGDVVSGNADIKTRDGFDHAYYLSLIVAIDNLSLFNKPN